ncbi:hypothetical protein ACLMJK_000416 [Lecanora helva]
MGLFSSSSSSSPDATTTSPKTSDGTPQAPTRQSRAQCWTARDNFFACLDRHGIIDSIKEKDRAETLCGGENKALEKECVGSWVTYFKQRRVMEHNKQQTLERLAREDARPLPEGVGSPGLKGERPS